MPVPAPVNFSPNAALLIDFDNVTMGIRSDLQTELKNLLSSDIIKGKVQLRRAYADWRRYPQYVAPLAESSIDMIMAPAYGSSKKNATDIRLAIDSLELVFTRPEIGTFILLSGDSDFSTLVIKLKEYGKYVIGVGIRESSSDLLVMNCDEYFSYNALAGLVRTDNEPTDGGVRRDPWELVTAALQRMQRNEDVMRADRLKQVMQDIDSSFDEKNLGMSKFSRFVQEAAHRGLLTVSKLENGQMEVGPPRSKSGASEDGAPPAEPIAAAPAPSEERVAERTEERGRRSRRGGRGRGREGRGSRAIGTPATTAGEPTNESAPASDARPTAATSPQHAVLHHVSEPSPVAPRAAGQHPPAVGPAIGHSGERLTREEAFNLVRRAVASLVEGDAAIRASLVRSRAFELLGRDSESLSERNFAHILRDAHDADIIDLRRLGDDYEVAQAAVSTPVSEQLNVAAAAHITSPGVAAAGRRAAGAPAPPRGLGPRGAPSSRRGASRSAAPLPELLTVGIVGVSPATSRHQPGSEGIVGVGVGVGARAGGVGAAPVEGPLDRTVAANGVPSPAGAEEAEASGAGPAAKRVRTRTKSGRVPAITEPGDKKPKRPPRGRSARNATE
jgi:uncharacterized LabA/DUF88 family protein